MIFKRISHQLALQFTGFVFALLIVTGGIFLAGDVANRNEQRHRHLDQMLRPLVNRPQGFGAPLTLPSFQRDRIRILDASGETLVSGALYEDLDFDADDEISTHVIGDEPYDILTTAVHQDGQIIGYIQVADRAPPNDLLFRIVLFLFTSAGISVLTYGVGLMFARSSLKPAETMVERLEQFTQDASHELRTPITAVSTSLDLALATNDYPENVRAAKRDLKEVAALVERLLELARLDSFLLETETLDLSALVEECAARQRTAVQEKGLTLETNVAPGVSVKGDPTLLKQVIGNLITNAIKFNVPNGAIYVDLTPVSLSVRDTGKGIAPESLPHVFDRFFQEDKSRTKRREGLGLGLA
ncbi:MAG TPA: HAMP domain-containing sensor histidine kinase, partial [Candidatus Peribacteria bacterium]|nr:HAMP domain-containing sensor histidine kinase [Candidatus Peribacteria bacterium]